MNVTDTLEACEAAARPDVDPAYYGYCVQCELDLIEGDMSLTFLIRLTHMIADAPGQLSASAGISLNGYQIAAKAPVQNILSSYTIAAFDDCGGYVNPSDGYHYHAATAVEGCNSASIEDDTHGYHYHAAGAEQNQHIACYHGKTVAGEERQGGGPPPGDE